MVKIFCLTLFFLLLNNHVHAREVINVFVSIPPQKYLVERIGGKYVNVSVMVTPGRSPETYEPLPKQMALLGQAQLYFRIGVPFEKIWMDSIKSANGRMRVLDCCEEIAKVYYNNHTDHHHNDHKDNLFDPHVWTSPNNAKYLAGLIKAALLDEYPAQQMLFERNYQQLTDELDDLNVEISALLRDRRTRYIIVSHSSWAYFTDNYGIEQAALEDFGKEKGPRGIADLIDLARRERIGTVFLQKQYKTAAVMTLAKEINAKIIEIDPLAEDYINNLRMVAKYIDEATR